MSPQDTGAPVNGTFVVRALVIGRSFLDAERERGPRRSFSSYH